MSNVIERCASESCRYKLKKSRGFFFLEKFFKNFLHRKNLLFVQGYQCIWEEFYIMSGFASETKYQKLTGEYVKIRSYVLRRPLYQ